MPWVVYAQMITSVYETMVAVMKVQRASTLPEASAAFVTTALKVTASTAEASSHLAVGDIFRPYAC